MGKRSPHYIPELDPERSKFDWNSISDYYCYFSYLLVGGMAAWVFAANGEWALAFSIGAFAIGMVFLSSWLRRRERRKEVDASSADARQSDGKERAQSPHYIPELDPHSDRHKKGFGDPVLWLSIVFSVVSVIGSIAAWRFGFIEPMKFFASAGVISFSPLVIIGFESAFSGGA